MIESLAEMLTTLKLSNTGIVEMKKGEECRKYGSDQES